MATYNLRLTPQTIGAGNVYVPTEGTQGSLDTSVVVVGGVAQSTQRTGYMTTAEGGDPQLVKVTELNDGGQFTDTLQTIGSVPGVVPV